MTQECPQGPPNPDDIEALYPEGSEPQLRIDTLSALCSYGMTPLVMTGAIRQFLIQRFSDARNILNSSLRERMEREGVWREDANTGAVNSGIVIESLHRWTPELTEARPGLIIKEGAWTWKRFGIGDKTGVDARSGRKYFAGYWEGSHVVFALNREGAEAQILATEAMKSMLWFEEEIAKQFELQRFVPVSIGEVAALKESREHYVVPIVVAYVVPEAWYIQQEAPRLKRIVFKAKDVLADY